MFVVNHGIIEMKIIDLSKIESIVVFEVITVTTA